MCPLPRISLGSMPPFKFQTEDIHYLADGINYLRGASEGEG